MQSENQEQPVNVAEIMRHIRETIAQRKADRGTFAPILPDLALPDQGDTGVLGAGVHKALLQASHLAEDIYVDYPIRWHTPVIGRTWAIVRRKIHGEVRTYVDSMIVRQMTFNAAIARVLRRIVEYLEDQSENDRLSALESEIVELRQRISTLEK